MYLNSGGNTGIGKETARDLLRRGARVIILCRDITKGEEAAEDIRGDATEERAGTVEVRWLDLASLASVRECADNLNAGLDKIDVCDTR